MVVSVHIADVGFSKGRKLRRGAGQLEGTHGCTYSEGLVTAPLSASLLPKPRLGRVALLASWERDEGIDEFLASHPVGRELAAGWHVRLTPLRVSGAWPKMPGLPERSLPVADEEPVAVLTLGRLRVHRGLAFLRAAAAAEAEAVAAAGGGGLLAGTGLARPPHVFSTFSIWRSAAAMKSYSYGREGTHQSAVRADRQRAFHHESAFIRFRPYASRGSWEGRDPLAGLIAEPALGSEKSTVALVRSVKT
jgi:hypothetical protein